MSDNAEVQSAFNRQGEATLSDEGRMQEFEDRQRYEENVFAWDETSNAAVQEALKRRQKAGTLTQGKIQMDRSLPIGQGPGTRQVVTHEDYLAAKLFQLDQGMADQDEAFSPTMESTDAMRWSSDYMNHAIQQVQELDPELAQQLAFGERYLALFPEVAVTTRNGFGFAGLTEDLITDLLELDATQFSSVAGASLAESDTLDQFLHTSGKILDPGTKDLMFMSMATLSDKEQKHMAALAAAYVDTNPMETNEDQLNFINWFFYEAEAIYARESDNSLWGKLGRTAGKIFTEPANWIQDEVIGSVWNAATDPADAWYRKDLTLEETTALSFGLDVGSAGWATYTGIAGAGIDIVIDPTNIAFAALSGIKAAKTLAMIDDVASVSGRAGLAARQLIPFAGGKRAAALAGLPKGVRGRSARFAWAFAAKTQDQMIETARTKGVFDAIANASSYTAVIEKVPELRNAPLELVEYMLKQPDADAVQAAYTAAFKGDFLDQTSTAYKALKETADKSKKNLTDVLTQHFDELNAGDIYAARGGNLVHPSPVRMGRVSGYTDDEIAKLQSIADDADESFIKVGAERKPGADSTNIYDEIEAEIADFGSEAFDEVGSVTHSDGNVYSVLRTQNTTPDGDPYAMYAIADEAGNIRGGVLGAPGRTLTNDAGVVHELDEELRGSGVMSQVWDIARQQGDDFILQSGQSRSISEAGLGFARKEARKVLESDKYQSVALNAGDEAFEGTGTVTFVRKTAKIDDLQKREKEIGEWIANNTKYRNGGRNADGTFNKQALQAYMRAHELDGFATASGGYIFRNADELAENGHLVQVPAGRATNEAVAAAVQNRKSAQQALRINSSKNGEVSKWVVSDMPMKVQSEAQNFKFWQNKLGVFGGKAYSEQTMLERKLRGFVAKVFVDDVPPSIRLGWTNRQQGSDDLRRLLVQMQIDPENVARHIDSYLSDPSKANVDRIIRDAAAEIGDHQIALGLMRFQDKSTSTLEYAVINGENLTQGVRADGTAALQPLIPSQTSDVFMLPDTRTMSAHLRRLKRAQNRTFNVRNRGFGSTKSTRAGLIEGFAKKLATQEAKDAFNALDDHDKWAMAYAVTRPAGSSLADGLGLAGKVGQNVAAQWRGLKNAFSVAMLAWRPIGWVGNEFLDNSWRSAMAGTLSFFRHPFASGQAYLDARRIEVARQNAAAYLKHAESVVTAARNADDPLEAASKIIPNIREFVEAGETSEDTVKAIRSFLSNEILYKSNTIDVLDKPLAQALHRQRKGHAAAERYKLTSADGLVPDPDWDDVSVTGWENQFARNHSSASQRFEWSQDFTDPEALEGYTTAWFNTINRDLRDPVIRAYLKQYADLMEGGENSAAAARSILGTDAHQKMKEPIASMIRGMGLDPTEMDDFEQLAWYFKHKIDPYVRDQFGPLLNGPNARTLSQGVGAAEIGGEWIGVDLDDIDSFRNLVSKANGNPEVVMPQSVVGVFNPRDVFGFKGTNPIGGQLRRYNQWALQKFGHDIPIQLQRRPAFLRSMKGFKTSYMNMGLSEEAATIAAQQRSIELINKSFFYLEAQTPFLKSMNNVLPFFAAQWEIVRAWTWKVPTLNNWGGVGHARMLRSFDHVFNSLRRNGLLVPQYEDGEVSGWDLSFAQDPSTKNVVGSTLSRAGYTMLAAPSIFVEQIAEIATGMDLDLTPESFNFKFNHPYDFFGKGGGVLPTARMQIGLHPAAAPVAANVREALPFTSSSVDVRTTGGNAQLFMDENEITDVRGFLALNWNELRKAGIDEGDLSKVRNGTMPLEDLELPEGITLVKPNSSLIGDMLDTVLFPYGQVDGLAEASSNFVPNTVKNVFRSIALYANNGDIDGMTSWLVPPVLGPTGRYGIGVAYADAASEIEMRTGIFTRRTEVAEELGQLEGDDPRAFELQAELEAIDDTITKEVRNAATSRAFVNALYSITLPANPRTPTEQQDLRSYYYDALETAENWSEGEFTHMPYSNRKVTDMWDMVLAWASDPTGSAAKMEFLSQGGGQTAILAAIAPRTFWGPAGPPSQVDQLADFFEQVESGDREAMPYDIRMQKYQRLVLQVEKEMAIVEAYGNDPARQAAAIVADREQYNALVDEFDSRYRALDLEDDLLDIGYAEWADRNEVLTYEDYVALEMNDRIEAIDTAISEVELDLFPTDPQEAIAIAGQLKGIRSGIYAMLEQYNDSKYEGYEESPRQAYLNQYYEQLGTYYDQLGELYEKVDAAESKAEQDAMYTKIAEFQRAAGYQAIVVDGVVMASPEEYSWASKTNEERTVILRGKSDDKIEWFTGRDIERFITDYPKSATYLPVTPQAQAIMDAYSAQVDEIATAVARGGQYEGQSPADAYKVSEANAKQLLLQAGEFGVLEAWDDPPVLRQAKWGMLPEQLKFMVPQATAIDRQLKAHEKSILTKEGTQMKYYMHDFLEQQFAANPQARSTFIEWGQTTFGESHVETIVSMMLGDYRGNY